jgi:hypothetical protein
MPGSIGDKIGEGAFSDVHAWAPGQVVKLFKPGRSQRLARHEARMTRPAFAAGARAADAASTHAAGVSSRPQRRREASWQSGGSWRTSRRSGWRRAKGVTAQHVDAVESEGAELVQYRVHVDCVPEHNRN